MFEGIVGMEVFQVKWETDKFVPFWTFQMMSFSSNDYRIMLKKHKETIKNTLKLAEYNSQPGHVICYKSADRSFCVIAEAIKETCIYNAARVETTNVF